MISSVHESETRLSKSIVYVVEFCLEVGVLGGHWSVSQFHGVAVLATPLEREREKESNFE